MLYCQRMHTFWRQWLASQRYRCWRESLPGRIPVKDHSWSVVTCFICSYQWQEWSSDCQPAPWLCRPCVCQVAIVVACKWGYDAMQCHRLWVSKLATKFIVAVLQLECNKLMDLTASFHGIWLFWLSCKSRAEAPLSKWVPTGAQRKEWWKFLQSISQHGTSFADGHVWYIV